MTRFCLSIYPQNYTYKEDIGLEDPDKENNIPDYNSNDKKRSLYSEGGSFSKEGRLGGVDRLIMLCTVPEVSESYENIKKLFDLVQINKIPFKFVADFKLLLTVNGLQTASSTYLSPYCCVDLKTLRSRALDVINKGNHKCSELRTYGDLNKCHDRLEYLYKKVYIYIYIKLIDFYNCIYYSGLYLWVVTRRGMLQCP